MKRTYYDILQIPFNATFENIKRARNQLALKYHPDRIKGDKGNTTDRFTEMMAAYTVLSDTKKKTIYNALISKKLQVSFSNAILQPVISSGIFSPVEIDRIKAGLIAREILDHRKKSKLVLDKKDLEVHVDYEITLEDVYRGSRKEVLIKRLRHCPDCDGTGAKDIQNGYECPNCLSLGFELFQQNAGTQCLSCFGSGVIIQDSCPTCKGKGHFQEAVPVHFSIPKGANAGTVVRLPAEGDQMKHKAGELFIHLNPLLKHSVFTRLEQDLQLSFYVDPVFLVQGGALEIPTLKGALTIGVKRGRGEHKVLIKRAGMPYYSNRTLQYGHLHIKLIPDYSIQRRMISRQKKKISDFFVNLDQATVPQPKKSVFSRTLRKLKGFIRQYQMG